MIKIPQTRGAKMKYDFGGMEVGDTRIFPTNNIQTLLICAKGYAKRNGLDWGFRCYTIKNKNHIVRIR